MKTYIRQLCPTLCNDGKWHLIGTIYEKELSDISVKGFDTYTQALDTLIKWGYTEFKTN